MVKLVWETSKLKPPYWWQLRLAKGQMTISIQYREKFYSPVGRVENPGYHVQVGQGWDARTNILPTLPEAKSWGMQEVEKVLKEIHQEFQPEIPWLLLVCLVGVIALHIAWILLLN